MVKNPNWLAYRRWTSWLFTSVAKDLNSGPTKNKSSEQLGQNWNSGPPDYKSSTLTTQPPCLIIHPMQFHTCAISSSFLISSRFTPKEYWSDKSKI